MAVDWTVEADAATALRETYGIESDLADAALHAHALSAVAEIAARIPFGGTHVRHAAGRSRYIRLHPPAASITTVVEDGTTVDAADFRLLLDGRILERLVDDEPDRWGANVVTTYVGHAADERYDRVVADLVTIALEYSGLDVRSDGDYEETAIGARDSGTLGYQGERERLIGELMPPMAGVMA